MELLKLNYNYYFIKCSIKIVHFLVYNYKLQLLYNLLEILIIALNQIVKLRK